ncbi:MAG TPA: hypothetical protein VFV10_19820 [Gammaproteobacteria bacterium]|nr:hypothetical protein [Gammaproteobacteria bacterium]
MQVFENLPPIVGLILGFVLLVWLVFVFLVPFMIEGIRQSSRKTHEELVELNEKLAELNARLADAVRAAPAARGPAEARGREAPSQSAKPDAASPARGRREPTISETDFQNEPRPTRREPRVK